MRATLTMGLIGAAGLLHFWTTANARQRGQEVAVPSWLEGLDLRPTYTEGAGLIFDRRCSGCHREEGLGPMSLASLADLRESSVGTQTPMKDAITLSIMPPWPADPTVGSFANDARLSAVEIDLLERFIEGGYARGDGEYEPAEAWSGAWTIGRPDAVFELPEHTLGEDVENEVVEVVVRTDFPEDRWIVSAEALPGDEEVVLSIEGGPLGSYRWGNSFVRHRPGTARRLAAGQEITVRVRYRKSRGYATTDLSRLGVIFAADMAVAPDELLDAPMIAESFGMAARQEGLEVSTSFEFPSAGKVHSLMPVMFHRGSSVQYVARFPDGRELRLLSIPVWDPNWTLRYVLSEPLSVPGGTVIVVTGRFDNSLDNVRNPDPWSDLGAGPAGETLEGWLAYSLDVGG